MRVLHVIKSLGRGGAEMLLVEGLRAADPRTLTLRYAYYLPWKDALVRPLVEQGAKVTCLAAKGALGMLARTDRLRALVRDERIDLVHAHLPWAGVVARIAGALEGVPVVYSEHNLQERYHAGTRAANLATWHMQARVIAVSDDVKQSAERLAGTRVPVQVVKNGVSLHHFTREADAGRAMRRALSLDDDARVVGTVAVFRTQKRLDLWLEAAKGIVAREPRARFVLVGDGPLRADVERHVAERGLTDVVRLVGLQEEVRPYLSALDVYMMSSDFEGLPVALLEAMAMELPVVVTGVGGIPEVVRDGESGALVEKGRPEALAKAALTLLADDARRRETGARARAVVARGFGMDRMQRELEQLYDEVLATGARRRAA